jgi:hypothetical protein
MDARLTQSKMQATTARHGFEELTQLIGTGS